MQAVPIVAVTESAYELVHECSKKSVQRLKTKVLALLVPRPLEGLLGFVGL
jgi:hypothetical protein